MKQRKIIKKWRAKTYPLMAVSFYLDREENLNCQLTCNPKTGKELHDNSINMRIFGRNLAKSELFDKEDLKSLSCFCEAFLKEYQPPIR